MDCLNELNVDALELLQRNVRRAIARKQAVERRAVRETQRVTLEPVRAEKNAMLEAAGKCRVAWNYSGFFRWYNRYTPRADIVESFHTWFAAKLASGYFRDKKVQPPKVKYEDLPIEEKIRRIGNAAKHINLRVIELTACVEEEKAALAAAVGDGPIETARWHLSHAEDRLRRAKESQRKFAEKHC